MAARQALALGAACPKGGEPILPDLGWLLLTTSSIRRGSCRSRTARPGGGLPGDCALYFGLLTKRHEEIASILRESSPRYSRTG